MKKSKIIFIILSVLFVCIIMFFIYDFSRKTTFPGGADKTEPMNPSDTIQTGH